MKKFLFIVMTALFILAASGCNQSQKASLQATIDKSVQEEKIYTTASYENYIASLENAKKAQNDIFASHSKILSVQKERQNAIDDLVIAKKEIYKIDCSFTMLSNNHVGNEWTNTVTYNSISVIDESEIKININEEINLCITITEDDSSPDICRKNIILSKTNNYEKTLTLTVTEDYGRYYNNHAVWEVKCRAILIKRT